jgi:hypothetical protein
VVWEGGAEDLDHGGEGSQRLRSCARPARTKGQGGAAIHGGGDEMHCRRTDQLE